MTIYSLLNSGSALLAQSDRSAQRRLMVCFGLVLLNGIVCFVLASGGPLPVGRSQQVYNESPKNLSPKVGHAEYHDQTTVHPTGVAMLLLCGIAMLTLPRKRAMLALLACASLVPVGQRFVILTLDFNFMKIMLLFGWARCLLRNEYSAFRWCSLDYVFIGWSAVGFVAYVITHGESAIVYKCATTMESCGTYFLVRMLVRDLADVHAMIDIIGIIGLIMIPVFLMEYFTHRNLFAIMGGVPEFTIERQGKFRCQGAFAHPIMAGGFWAGVFPLLAGRVLTPRPGRITAVPGIIASLAIVVVCASSTPFLGLVAAFIGFMFLPIRRRMRTVLCIVTAILTALHCSMKAPIWHLIARTDIVGGSTGWHRANLIDQFVGHFSEWALFGVKDITHWNIWGNDITNQYVVEGVRGGGPTLILFLTMIAIAFRNVGRLWRRVANSREQVDLSWSIGVSVFVHTVNFIGATYFGQIEILWFATLALTTVSPVASKPRRLTRAQTQRSQTRPLGARALPPTLELSKSAFT